MLAPKTILGEEYIEIGGKKSEPWKRGDNKMEKVEKYHCGHGERGKDKSALCPPCKVKYLKDKVKMEGFEHNLFNKVFR